MATPEKKKNITCFCCLAAGQTRSCKLGGKKCEETGMLNNLSSFLDSTIKTQLVNCQAPICRGCLNFVEKWNIFKIMRKENADSYSQKKNICRTKRMYNSPCEKLSKCVENQANLQLIKVLTIQWKERWGILIYHRQTAFDFQEESDTEITETSEDKIQSSVESSIRSKYKQYISKVYDSESAGKSTTTSSKIFH
ncbi:unnamed protein product [Mytilus edulis]|uniref:Uncharacterized protein n=1 Tax=Mytilus edulis TaxID=6550 RepID=A0A8S3TLY3_MYTED|nr:unnamed protein product [Mytilus edulis]